MARRTLAIACLALCLASLAQGGSYSVEVVNLPGIGVPRLQTYSGLLLANDKHNGSLYYLLAESMNSAASDPLILWLQGGPGTSSMFGAFVENGPYTISGNGTFSWNPYAWTTNASLLWIDNPFGSGFSFVSNNTGYSRTEQQIATDLTTGLVAFMNLHPQFLNNSFYIFGESYAGKYVPWLADLILSDPSLGLRVDGIALGDGWVSPMYQTPSNAYYLYMRDRITFEEMVAANISMSHFALLLAMQKYVAAYYYDAAYFKVLAMQGDVTDPYDIRQLSDPTDPPYNAMVVWLETLAVREALGIAGLKFQSGFRAEEALDRDEEQAALTKLTKVLRQRPVLLYNGEWDMVCNFYGTAAYAREMEWAGQSCYAATAVAPWTVANGTVGGWLQAFGNLSRLVVAGAGHMSPFDQPANVHQMVFDWINGRFGKPGQPCATVRKEALS